MHAGAAGRPVLRVPVRGQVRADAALLLGRLLDVQVAVVYAAAAGRRHRQAVLGLLGGVELDVVLELAEGEQLAAAVDGALDPLAALVGVDAATHTPFVRYGRAADLARDDKGGCAFGVVDLYVLRRERDEDSALRGRMQTNMLGIWYEYRTAGNSQVRWHTRQSR